MEGRGKEFIAAPSSVPHPEKVCRACGAPAPHGQLCSNCGRTNFKREHASLCGNWGNWPGCRKRRQCTAKAFRNATAAQSCSKGVAFSTKGRPDQRRGLRAKNSAPTGFGHDLRDCLSTWSIHSLCCRHSSGATASAPEALGGARKAREGPSVGLRLATPVTTAAESLNINFPGSVRGLSDHRHRGQKFSSIQTLCAAVYPTKARWRPSGDGSAHDPRSNVLGKGLEVNGDA